MEALKQGDPVRDGSLPRVEELQWPRLRVHVKKHDCVGPDAAQRRPLEQKVDSRARPLTPALLRELRVPHR
eukprot:4363756-Prymnesium_polylepis.1